MHSRSVRRSATLALLLLGSAPVPAVALDLLPVEMLVENELQPVFLDQMVLEPQAEIAIEYAAPPPGEAVRVEEFRFNPPDGRFIARLRMQDGGHVDVGGRARLQVDAWVPVRRIEQGQVIAEADLREVPFPAGFLNLHALRSKEDIVGFETRRALLPDRPVQTQSLIEPRVIHKGDKVTIQLGGGNGLNISSEGKALEDGAKGTMIRVVNTTSNTIIMAEPIAPGIVGVTQ
ncbi:flagellar basal body P-ring formation chaperone FlgA [Paracoccus sp. ME4]|uniref:flagellar basal body P-ring formation chaperone FlgA n=1 Tax=Paracoccus sp. ME4 TaxID=3138066 RepID=UPI00398B9D40